MSFKSCPLYSFSYFSPHLFPISSTLRTFSGYPLHVSRTLHMLFPSPGPARWILALLLTLTLLSSNCSSQAKKLARLCLVHPACTVALRRLTCSLSPRDHPPLLPGVQFLEKHYFTYFVQFLFVVLCERI